MEAKGDCDCDSIWVCEKEERAIGSECRSLEGRDRGDVMVLGLVRLISGVVLVAN